MKNLKSKKYGFTLIELIIVIAIIAILAAIAVPAFGQIRQKANASADLGNARTIYSLVATEIASDSITLPTGDTPVVYELTAVGEADGNFIDIESQIEPKPVVKTTQGNVFLVKLDAEGNIIIGHSTAVDGTFVEVYPES